MEDYCGSNVQRRWSAYLRRLENADRSVMKDVLVAPTLQVDVPNVRAGADTIDAAKADVAAILVPACGQAVIPLPGLPRRQSLVTPLRRCTSPCC